MPEKWMNITVHITDTHIKAKLIELGFPKPTRKDIDKIKDHIRGIGAAWAGAALQDLTKDDAEFWMSDEAEEYE